MGAAFLVLTWEMRLIPQWQPTNTWAPFTLAAHLLCVPGHITSFVSGQVGVDRSPAEVATSWDTVATANLWRGGPEPELHVLESELAGLSLCPTSPELQAPGTSTVSHHLRVDAPQTLKGTCVLSPYSAPQLLAAPVTQAECLGPAWASPLTAPSGPSPSPGTAPRPAVLTNTTVTSLV